MKNNYFYKLLLDNKSIKNYSDVLNDFSGSLPRRGRMSYMYPMHPMDMMDMMPFYKEMKDVFTKELKYFYDNITDDMVSKYYNLIDINLIPNTETRTIEYSNDVVFDDYQSVFDALKVKRKVDNLEEIYKDVNLIYYSMVGVTNEKIIDKFLVDLSEQKMKYNLGLNWLKIMDNKPFSFYLMKNIINSLYNDDIHQVLELNADNYTPEQFKELFELYDFRNKNFTYEYTKELFILRYTHKSLKPDDVFDLLNKLDIPDNDGYGRSHLLLLGHDFFRYYLVEKYDEKILPFYYESGVHIKDILDVLPKKMITKEFIINSNVVLGKKYIDIFSLLSKNGKIPKNILDKHKQLLYEQYRHKKASLATKRKIYKVLGGTYYIKDNFLILTKNDKIKKLKENYFEYDKSNNVVILTSMIGYKYNIKNEIYFVFNGETYKTFEDVLKKLNNKIYFARNESGLKIIIPLDSILNIDGQNLQINSENVTYEL